MNLKENNYNHDIFMNSFPNILENEDLREPQIRAYASLYNHFIRDKNSNHALIVLPTGERVIIVMGAVNVMKPRVSGTLNKYILCIA